MVNRLHKLAVAEHRTACKIQIAAYLYHYVNLIGIAYGLKQYGLILIVVGIGSVNIGHQGYFAVGTLYVYPVIEILIRHTQKV